MSVPGTASGRRSGGWRPASLLRRLLRIDDVSPVDYQFARLSRAGYLAGSVPSPAEAREELHRRIDELARRGSLDEGSGHVLNPTIDSWVQEWSHHVEAEHDARQSVLQQRETHARAEAERLRELNELARQRLAEAEHRLAWLLAGADPRDHPGLRPSTNGRRTHDRPHSPERDTPGYQADAPGRAPDGSTGAP